MSDFWQAVVVVDSQDSGQRLSVIESAIMSFLWHNGVVADEQLEDANGYPPGPNAARYVISPEKWNWPECYLGYKIPHGLSVSRCDHPRMYGDCNEPVSLSCPVCQQRLTGLLWWEAPLKEIDVQLEATGTGLFCCPKCNASTDIRDVDTSPPSAVGRLAFEFANWPELQRDFVRELAAVAKADLQRVEWI